LSTEAAVDQVVAELRSADRLLLTTHESPDGDALGSLLAMHQVLLQLGKDSVMFLSAANFPLPHEYRFLPVEEVVNEAPADFAERTLVFLDCGNIDRMPVDFLQREDAHVLNIDHHHDNTRFGTVNLVDVQASCTAEIVYDIAKRMGVEVTLPIADALYVGLVTDTGKFMYENTDADAHRMAADLIDIGVDVHEVFRRLYEHVPYPKVRLLARALSNVERFENDALTVAYLSAADYRVAEAGEELTEGIVDHIRAIEGTSAAALIRDRAQNGSSGRRKVSLRAADGRIDVSAIARRLGGGGHRQAAGFSTDLPYEELVELLRREIAAQL
jgi:bifunctional oligoribonuclease and PAP phosphatase NrnA